MSEASRPNTSAVAPYFLGADIHHSVRWYRPGAVEIIRGPEKPPHDCEEIEIRDPDGHVICFATCW